MQGLGGSTLAKVLVGGLLLLKVRATPTREGVASTGCVAEKREAGHTLTYIRALWVERNWLVAAKRP